MKAVRVTYKVKPEYVETNKVNIVKVMQDLREINAEGVKYSSYLLEDGQSFMHFTIFKDEDSQKILNELDSFKNFVAALKASSPIEPPTPVNLSLVGSSYNIF